MSNQSNTISKPTYLFVLPWSLDKLGGVSQVVENLMLQMELHDEYLPMIMVNSWNDCIVRKATIHKREHYFLRLRSIYDNERPLKNFLGVFVFFFSELCKLHRFLKHHNVSVVNLHYCGFCALNFTLLKTLGLFNGKILLSFHGKHIFTSSGRQPVAKILWKLLLRTADYAITCSDALKNEVSVLDARSVGKMVAIHNGINMEFLQQERDRCYHLNHKLKTNMFVLNVATFEYNKGQDILLKAFAKIASLFPEIDLVMIGRPDNALVGLKSLAKELGLERRVWFYEGLPHNQLAAFYENATIFALPSRYEPFGIVILEAGAFGLPVIASCVGGIEEILSHSETARLCPPENIECFSFDLKYLLERSDERERLGSNLRRHIFDNFSWDRAYHRYAKCASGRPLM